MLSVAAGGEFRVNTTLPGAQQTPAIARDLHGNYVVVWTNLNAQIIGQRFNEAGVPLGGEFRISEDRADNSVGVGLPDIAMEPDGDFAVAWKESVMPPPGSDTYAVILARRYSQSGAAGSIVEVDVPTFHGGDDVHIAADADGDYVVAWHHQSGLLDKQEIRARQYRTDGGQLTARGDFFTVIPNNAAVSYRDPDVAADVNGNFVVVWHYGTGGGVTDVQARVYDSGGGTLGPPFDINHTRGKAAKPAVAMRGDGVFAVVWEDFSLGHGEIRARAFDFFGAPRQALDIPVNQNTGGNQVQPDVDFSTDGDFLVVWNGQAAPGQPLTRTVHAREFDADGIPGTNEFDVNENSPGGGFTAVAAGHCGDYLVAWQNGQNVADIWNRLFTSDINSSGAVLDTDGDALPDCWELHGYDVEVGGQTVHVDLPAMGANPLRKDIFVEVDYMVERAAPAAPGAAGKVLKSQQPREESLHRVRNAFLNAPVENPDGSTGIVLHIDSGPKSLMNLNANGKWFIGSAEWSDLIQATELPWQNELGTTQNDTYNWSAFDDIKEGPDGQLRTADDNFSWARRLAFHYTVYANKLGGDTETAGISRNADDAQFFRGAGDFILALDAAPSKVTNINEAGTFMHELGHNLGLGHGGSDSENLKPNYFSVMNYAYSWLGLITGNSIGGYDYGDIDYSRWKLNDLDEANLDEKSGIQGDGFPTDQFGVRYYRNGQLLATAGPLLPFDWDATPAQPSGLSRNLNSEDPPDPDFLSTLVSHNDWKNLVFAGGAIGGRSALPPPLTTESEEGWILDPPDLGRWVTVAGLPGVGLAPGENVEHRFTVANAGTEADTYDLAIASLLGWADPTDVPASVTLQPGASQQIQVTITLPASIAANAFDQIELIATSQGNADIADSALVEVRPVVAVAADSPPTVVIATPQTGQSVIAGQVLRVRVDAADDVGVAAVDLLFGGNVLTDSTAPYEFNITIPGGASVVSLNARARDSSGQETNATLVTLNVTAALPTNVAVKQSGKTLVIEGDNAANHLLLEQIGVDRYRVSGENGTRLNGQTDPLEFRKINGVVISLRRGDDALEVRGAAGASGNWLIIVSGDGHDRITLDTIRQRGDTTIIADNGNDEVNVVNAMFERLVVLLGDGNDTFRAAGSVVTSSKKASRVPLVDGDHGTDTIDAGLLGIPNSRGNRFPRGMRLLRIERRLS